VSTSEHYDVIVVGRTISSLMTATLLAKRRLRVRVLDTEFPTEPNLPLFAMQTTPLLYTVTEELGLVHDLRTRLVAEPEGVTIALGDRRFMFHANPRLRARVLGEVMPGSESELLALFAAIEEYGPSLNTLLDGSLELPPDGFRARRHYERALEACHASTLLNDQRLWSTDPAIRDMVHALLMVAGQRSGLGEYMTPSALRTLWHLCYGLPSLRQGTAGVLEMLVQKLRSSGGTIEDERHIAHLDVRRKRVREVETKDGACFGADYIVMSGGDDTLGHLLSNDTYGSPQDNCLGLSVPATERPRLLRDPCGWVPEAGTPYAIRIAGDQMEIRWPGSQSAPDLEALMPFSDVVPGASDKVSGDTTERLDDLELFHSPLRGPLKNLVYIGHSVLPGLGLESACYTAYTAASILEQAASSRWPFGKNI
jgi:hypothetical protein